MASDQIKLATIAAIATIISAAITAVAIVYTKQQVSVLNQKIQALGMQ